MIEGLESKRHDIVAHLDRCIALADSDATRALAAIAEAHKALQALRYRIWEAHHTSGGRHKRPAFAANAEGL